MTAHGLQMLDHTVQLTHEWIGGAIHCLPAEIQSLWTV